MELARVGNMFSFVAWALRKGGNLVAIMFPLASILCIAAIAAAFSFAGYSYAAASEGSLIFQEDFEEPTADGKAPGWSVFSGNPLVTADRAYSGKYSVKIEDTSTTVSAGLRSPRIPIKEGVTYVARVESFNESGVSQLYLEFWDDTGTRNGVFISDNSSQGEWAMIAVSGKAPRGARTATLLVYSHTGNVGVSYYDNAELLCPGAPPQSIFTGEKVSFIPKFSGEHKAVIQRHPRLYFTPADIERIKASGFARPAYLNEGSFTVGYYGGKTVTYPLPPVQPAPMGPPPGFTAGDYPYWTGMSRAIEVRMEDLALSYLTTGDERYAKTAIDYALSLAKWKTWNEFGYTSLSVAHLTFGMIAVYDILYDRMTEEERRTIRRAVIEKAIIPISAVAPKEVDHNIHLLGNMAMGLAALTFLGEEDGMASHIKTIKDWAVWYLDARANSGKTEGLGYTSYALENLVKFADALGRITGDNDLMDHPYLRDELARWAIYFMAPGGKSLVNFSDAGYGPGFYITMNVLARRYGNGYAGWYLEKTGLADSTSFESVVYGSGDLPVTSPDSWPEAGAFNIGWAALRSGWGDGDTLLAFLSSSSDLGHNHMDQNHFVLNTNGEWLIIDPGYQDYSPGPKHDVTYATIGHNAMLFDGKGQSVKGGGVMVGFLASPVLDYVAGDATAAYANLGLGKWQRDILSIKPGYFLMIDEVKAGARERSVDLLLHMDKDAIVVVGGESPEPGQTLEADKVGIFKLKASAIFQPILPEGLKMTYDLYKGAEEFGPYIRVSSPGKVKATDFVSLITTRAHEGFPITKRAEPLDVKEKVTEAFISLGVDAPDTYDIILYNRTGSDVSDGRISTDGRYGVVSLDRDGKIARLALIGGRDLSFVPSGGESRGEKAARRLVEADSPVSLAFGYRDGLWVGTVQAQADTAIRIWTPKFKEVREDGKTLDENAYSYDEVSGILEVRVKEGTSRFEFR